MKKKIAGGTFIIVFTLIVAIFAPFFSRQDPNAMSLPNRLEGPSWEHPFGRDENGSDVLSKLVYGARVSLGVAWTVVLISGTLGLLIGSVSGYAGGLTDQIIMRVTDLFYAFPGFLIALTLVAVLGPSLRNLIFALCITSWSGLARLVRGEVLHLKERENILSARALGAGDLRIVVRHIWPNLISLVIIQSTFAMAGTVISESGLSFLGLGVPPSTPTWGSLLNSGRHVMTEAPHVSLAPGLAIVVLVLGFNLLGDGLRDALDPRRA
jgi:peptide/nickel transport system permease protein